MLKALPLSKDSIAARVLACCSIRSANLVRQRPRVPVSVVRHSPSNALRAAETAMSTSFSVASWTATMGFSLVGLMVSKVLPSTPFTHSLLMNLSRGCQQASRGWWGTQRGNGTLLTAKPPRSCEVRVVHRNDLIELRMEQCNLQASRLLIFSRCRCFECLGQRHDGSDAEEMGIRLRVPRGCCTA